MSLTTSTCLESCHVASTTRRIPPHPRSVTWCIRVKFCNNVESVEFEFGSIVAKRFPIWSLDLDSLLDFAQSGYIHRIIWGEVKSSKQVSISFELYLSHWLDPHHPHSLLVCTLSFRQGSRCQSVSATSPSAIASRKCCLSSTRQIKTSFLLHWHSSYHCSKHIFSPVWSDIQKPLDIMINITHKINVFLVPLPVDVDKIR